MRTTVLPAPLSSGYVRDRAFARAVRLAESFLLRNDTSADKRSLGIDEGRWWSSMSRRIRREAGQLGFIRTPLAASIVEPAE
jgi:hypothetical protein